MTSDHLPILIAGSGIAGLALANVLQEHGVPFRVFERDASHDARTQGFSLTLHFSIDKLLSLIDPKKAETYARDVAANPSQSTNGFEVVIMNGSTNEILAKHTMSAAAVAAAGNRDPIDNSLFCYIRANRHRLRNWLAEGIPIEYGKAVDKYEVLEDGTVKTTFLDGTTARGTALIGADGAYSAVARQWMGPDVLREETRFSRVYALGATVTVSLEQYKAIAEISSALIMSHGFALAESPPRLFVAQQDIRPDSPYLLHWIVSCSPSDGTPAADLPANSKERLEYARTALQSANFSGPLADLVYRAPEDICITHFPLPERSPPAIFDDILRDPVTLIGDAAHPMAPFRGEGANHATLDACLLGEHLIAVYHKGKGLLEALSAYQAEMTPRGRSAVEASHHGAELLHSKMSDIIAFYQSLEVGHKDLYEKASASHASS